jgi:hypothetical protein
MILWRERKADSRKILDLIFYKNTLERINQGPMRIFLSSSKAISPITLQ